MGDDPSRTERLALTDSDTAHSLAWQWDLLPVTVSLLVSFVMILRSAVSINGHRTYLLFDDSAISLTYGRSLATGHGLVWIAGQHPVEGYSNFLWTLWMAAIELAHPSDYLVGLWVMISGAALLAGNVYLVVRITRRVSPHSQLAPVLAGLAVALYYALNSWTLIGMETGLVTILTSAALLCLLRACDARAFPKGKTFFLVSSGAFLALNVLTRDDGIIVAAAAMVFVIARLRPRIPALIATGLPVLVAVLGHLIFRLEYYGHPVPNTYYLKLSGIDLMTRIDRGLVVLVQNATMQLVVPIVLAALYFVLVRRGSGRPALGTGLMLGIFVAQSAYIVYVGGDSYDQSFSDRYLATVVPYLLILSVLGAIATARALRISMRPLLVGGLLIVGAGVFVYSMRLPVGKLQEIAPGQSTQLQLWGALIVCVGIAFILLSIVPELRALSPALIAFGLVIASLLGTNAVPVVLWFQQGTTGFALDRLVARYGAALASSTAPGTTVAVSGAGNITFFDHRRSIDLLGFSDHFIATSKPHSIPGVPFQPGHDKWDYDYSIGQLRPDAIFGLFYPSSADLRNLTRWGYQSYHSPQANFYYLPGRFDPARFIDDLPTVHHRDARK